MYLLAITCLHKPPQASLASSHIACPSSCPTNASHSLLVSSQAPKLLLDPSWHIRRNTHHHNADQTEASAFSFRPAIPNSDELLVHFVKIFVAWKHSQKLVNGHVISICLDFHLLFLLAPIAEPPPL